MNFIRLTFIQYVSFFYKSNTQGLCCKVIPKPEKCT